VKREAKTEEEVDPRGGRKKKGKGAVADTDRVEAALRKHPIDMIQALRGNERKGVLEKGGLEEKVRRAPIRLRWPINEKNIGSLHRGWVIKTETIMNTES